MRLLLIDHDDSFTFILAQMLGASAGVLPKVLNHKTASLEEIRAYQPTHLILSPGPGSVENPGDFAIGQALLDEWAGRIPILGVCLGHQGIAAHFGGRIIHAPQPLHGKLSCVQHLGKGLFAGLPNPLKVMRYHSLAVADLPSCLEATAWSEDGVIMGLQHRELPIYGVQFHPESVGTEQGQELLGNFVRA